MADFLAGALCNRAQTTARIVLLQRSKTMSAKEKECNRWFRVPHRNTAGNLVTRQGGGAEMV
jgi:hypothetical protein